MVEQYPNASHSHLSGFDTDYLSLCMLYLKIKTDHDSKFEDGAHDKPFTGRVTIRVYHRVLS